LNEMRVALQDYVIKNGSFIISISKVESYPAKIVGASRIIILSGMAIGIVSKIYRLLWINGNQDFTNPTFSKPHSKIITLFLL